MSAVEQIPFSVAVERLGDEVWEALTAGDCDPHHYTGDGFDVIRPIRETSLHVLVHDRREGALHGVGRWQEMNAHRLAPYQQAIEAAGFAVAQLEVNGGSHALIVARDAETATQAVQFALGAADPQGGEGRG